MAAFRHSRAACAFAIGATLVAHTAAAQTQRGFSLDRFEPAERGSHWFVNDSLDLRGHLRPAAGVVGSWSYNPLVVYDRNGGYVSSLVAHQVFVHAGGSLVLWNRVRAGLNLPVAVYQSGDSVLVGTKGYIAPGAALGDLRLSGDARVFGTHGGVITGAVGLAAYLPTGSRDDYTSDGTVRVYPRVVLAGDVAMFSWSARGGVHVRPLTERFERNPLGSELTYGLAAGVRLANRQIVVGPELFGGSIVDSESFLKRRGSPVELLLGGHYTIAGFRFGAGAGPGLSRGWGTPELRAFLSAEWAPEPVLDGDGDGVPDEKDACPTVRGVRTRDPRTNGCPALPPPPPPPSDRDGDGIEDREDACPDAAGPRDDDPKKNGCPPEPPPPPPPDRDGDGIPDEKDACPETPGAPSEDPLSNGCPSDRDGDGVYDAEDACPDAPGAADPDPKKNGCPLARIEGGQIKILEQVRFRFGSAEILRDSDPTLLAVATTLKAHPELVKVRVEGHTDSKGREDTNLRLSHERAAAVVKWLVTFGIDKARLEAVGFGARRPVDSNATDDGRQNNRRVEFQIMVTKPKPR